MTDTKPLTPAEHDAFAADALDLAAEVRRLRRVVAKVGDGVTADDECDTTVVRRASADTFVQHQGVCRLPLCHDGEHVYLWDTGAEGP
ncbi:MAG: hypothetical protein WC876_01785 [Candidatus Thermoplasmatota archaeon]|jgi:hypothetical protein